MAEMEPERATLHQQLTAVLSGALWDRGHDIRKWPEDEAAAYRHFRFDAGNAAAHELRMRKAATAVLTLIRVNAAMPEVSTGIVAPMTALQAAAAEFFRPAPPSASGDEAKALEAARNQRLAAILAPYAPER
tara:strand:+ start:2463 stop:2858 length:396 start_codon:yes stop_codon:yes gene_type:complete